MHIYQKDKKPLERARDILGVGKISYSGTKTPLGNKSWIYRYYLHGKRAIKALESMLPFLTVKRSKAIAAIALKEFAHNKTDTDAMGQLRMLCPSGRERFVEICRLKQAGASFEQIGASLNISKQRVHQLYKEGVLI